MRGRKVNLRLSAPVSEAEGLTVIYTVKNSGGHVLYVGATANLRLRLRSHPCTKEWWTEVAEVSWVAVDPESKYAAEAATIRASRPRYNVFLNRPAPPLLYPVKMHGRTGYAYGCRCDGCRAAARLSQRGRYVRVRDRSAA